MILSVVMVGCGSQGQAPPDKEGSFEQIDILVEQFIEREAFPGAAVAIGQRDTLHKLTAYGNFTYESGPPVTPQSVFDLASLTKVIATTTAAMLLYEQDLIDLDATVRSYLPDFDSPDKADITIRQLLTHTAGFIPWRPFYETTPNLNRALIIDSIFTLPLDNQPGETYSYSDFSMIILMFVIEEITGQDFASFSRENIFEPLGISNTDFLGTGTPDSSVVPTELDDYFRNRLIQGEVHDETAWVLGGTSGHAGLFSSAEDVARFAAMMAQGGLYDGGVFLNPETIEYFTSVVDSDVSSRALGWDTKSTERSSSGAHFGPLSFGHTGFTGTSMWIDPDTGVYVILLTNRVYPSRERHGIGELRPMVADLAYEALVGIPY